MNRIFSAGASPRRSIAPVILVVVLLSGWCAASVSQSQVPAATTNNAAINALLLKLKAQQDQMTDNQTKIEAQTAQLQETIRQAKIYSARSGSGHR